MILVIQISIGKHYHRSCIAAHSCAKMLGMSKRQSGAKRARCRISRYN